jgi:hypothetical protein
LSGLLLLILLLIYLVLLIVFIFGVVHTWNPSTYTIPYRTVPLHKSAGYS